MKLRDQEDEEEVLPSYSNHPLTSDTENSSSGSASHKDVNKASTADPTFENDCPFTLDNIRHWMYLTLGLIIGLLLIINLSNARNSSTSTTTTTSTATGMRAFDISNAIILNKDDINVQSTAFMSYYSYPSQSSSNVVYARLSKWVVDKQAPLLYVEQITKGVGIVDLFWDPADIIGQDEMKFRLDPSGTRVLLFARQNRFRGDASLMQESFAESVLGSFAIINVDESSYWIDFSSFTQSNVGLLHGKDLASAISSVYGSQYCYAFDSELSFLDTNVVKANSYRSTFQSLITYSMCNKQGASLPVKYFEQSLASSTHLSITVRRTFIKLRPLSVDAHAITNNDDDGYSKSDLTTYVPRWFHPKSGFNSIAFRNEDKSLWSSRLTQYITRFNLSPTAPSNQKIQFYVDRNIPEPYLTAIIEGIMWWDAAFQFAGYKAGTFSAKVAAADLDPFDFYTDGSSFVHWIDRDVRFYSIGLRVIDPRTGEVLKGHVRLEGLRIRQDALLAQALLSKDSYSSELQRKGDILSCIMQRVRHLGAHEVGHALGLAHNFAGSTSSSGYSSVMDYPPPLVQMKDGQLRLNEDSYSNGIGIFDKVSIKYGYGPFASDRMEVEQQLLIDYLSSAEQQYGYVFLTDENSADSAADWRDTRWDQGTNPIEALQSSMEVRKKALQSLNLNSFVETSIPLARLMELFPMIYLWHR